MRHARVLITTECNLQCKYCCNKLPEVQESIKMTTFDEILNMKYESISITGGEPLLEPDKLKRLVKNIRKASPETKIYLYTNGFNADKCKVTFDGINIGCHESFYQALNAGAKYLAKNKNVRIHAQKGTLTPSQRELVVDQGMHLKEWVMNECDNELEDRYII